MPRCHLALGGNVGSVEDTFAAALSRLGQTLGLSVQSVSPIFRTRAIGDRAGEDFLNAAAQIEASLEPLDLLDLLQNLERQAGRTAGPRWGPRPLDLDLIFYADRVIDHQRLQIPHPACWYRRFVLDPLAAIAPNVRHPTRGATIAELRARLLPRPLPVAVAGSTSAHRIKVTRALGENLAGVNVTEWPSGTTSEAAEESDDPAIVAWLGPTGAPGCREDEFSALPVISRLDISAAIDPITYLREVVQSALGGA